MSETMFIINAEILLLTSILDTVTVNNMHLFQNGIKYSPGSQTMSNSHIFHSLDPSGALFEPATLKRTIVNDTTSFQMVSFVNLTTNIEMNAIKNPSWVDGVFWNKEVEEVILAFGYCRKDDLRWQKYIGTSSVVEMSEGCGRDRGMQNRLLVFKDGTKACCRYRNDTKLIQGEIFSFYLGRILGLKNLTPTSLAVVKTNRTLWSKVKPQVLQAQWNEGTPVAVTMYLDSLEPAYFPRPFLSNNKHLDPGNSTRSLPEAIELAQWSDLIVFDYLTANYDRVVRDMCCFGWHADFTKISVHNLKKNSNLGLLVFLDNENGLLEGYQRLVEYEPCHSILLEALCVFRKPTIDALVKLKMDGNFGYMLNKLSFDAPDQRVLPILCEKNIEILNSRIERVLSHVAYCEKQYTRKELDSCSESAL